MTNDVPAGHCPQHGIVSGDTVVYNFPNPAECGLCGEELDKCTIATEEELEAYTSNNGGERQRA